jgi:hypothetical protein
MSETREKLNLSAPPTADKTIYPSAPSEPDDDFWLAQGRLMLTESLATVRNAANALMTGLGVLQGIYLGILGFAKFIPEELPLAQKALFIVPLLVWLLSLYFCLEVAMTSRLEVYMHSPEDIREKSTRLLLEKQRDLEWAFWLLALGLLAAFGLLVYRLK